MDNKSSFLIPIKKICHTLALQDPVDNILRTQLELSMVSLHLLYVE